MNLSRSFAINAVDSLKESMQEIRCFAGAHRVHRKLLTGVRCAMAGGLSEEIFMILDISHRIHQSNKLHADHAADQESSTLNKMTAEKSDTPRTDEAEYSSRPGNPMFNGGYIVIKSSFAKQLERELIKAIEQRDRAIKIAEEFHELEHPIHLEIEEGYLSPCGCGCCEDLAKLKKEIK